MPDHQTPLIATIAAGLMLAFILGLTRTSATNSSLILATVPTVVAIVADSPRRRKRTRVRGISASVALTKAIAASPERRVLLYWHSLGNRMLTWFTNVLNDLNLTDMETCYKMMRADLLKTKDDLLITKQVQSKNYRVASSTEDVDSEYKEV